MSIGSRIKEARKQRQFTQEDMARIIGVTKGAIANYENEVSTPKLELLLKLMDVLKVDANYLYQDDIFIETESVCLGQQMGNLTDADIKVAHAYHNADVGTQSSVKKLLDVTDANNEELAIEREVASYRAELEAEAKGAAKSKASQTSKGA